MASIKDIIYRFARYCGGSETLARLLVANVGISLILWIAIPTLKLCGRSDAILYTLTALPSDPLTLATHPWTLLSYMFVQFSPLHLLFNMLWLYWFARILADSGRHKAIARLYLGGGLAGGVFYILVSLLTNYMPGAYLTGASAAVLAIVCAAAIHTPNRRINLFLFGEVRLKWVAIVCVVLTIAGTWSAGAPTFAAHTGGIIFGLSMAGGYKYLPSISPKNAAIPGYRLRRKLNIKATVKAMNNNAPDEARLDELLDKMRVSGYDSLSAKEKSELNYISSRLK